MTRAVRVAGLEAELETTLDDLFAGCVLVDADERLLRLAAAITSSAVRTPDAIHLATALDVQADVMLVYAREAARLGIRVEAPGAVT